MSNTNFSPDPAHQRIQPSLRMKLCTGRCSSLSRTIEAILPDSSPFHAEKVLCVCLRSHVSLEFSPSPDVKLLFDISVPLTSMQSPTTPRALSAPPSTALTPPAHSGRADHLLPRPWVHRKGPPCLTGSPFCSPVFPPPFFPTPPSLF